MATAEELQEQETITIPKISGCARCGGTHENLEARKYVSSTTDTFLGPVTHFAMCPVLDQPIHFQFFNEDALPKDGYVPTDHPLLQIFNGLEDGTLVSSINVIGESITTNSAEDDLQKIVWEDT